jgi:hypothetical protein
MKDFTIKFSWKNLFKDVPEPVAKLQLYIKGSSFISGLAAFPLFGIYGAAVAAGVGFALDILMHFISLEEKK